MSKKDSNSVPGLEQNVHSKINFLILDQNICCGYSKELPQWNGSLEHQRQMLKLKDKKIFSILRPNITYVYMLNM